MNASFRLDGIEIIVAEAAPATRWIFIRVVTEDGRSGYGESTLSCREALVAETLDKAAGRLFAADSLEPDDLFPCLDSLPQAALCSGFDQAIWDLRAGMAGLPLARLLNPLATASVPVYANINRRTKDRSPHGFAESAALALRSGHVAVKIAPFDEAPRTPPEHEDLDALLRPGLERIAAVREVLGPDKKLMVDCHWRLNKRSALKFLDFAAGLGLYWVECPLPESGANLAALAELRAVANGLGVLLAGCEEKIRLSGFKPFIDAKCYDVIMPDAKYAGGVLEMLKISGVLLDGGIDFSPHNPSGPICHAVSAHIRAAAEGNGMLETQFDETPVFDELNRFAAPPVVDGALRLPERPGHGAALNMEAPRKRCVYHKKYRR